MPHHNYPSDTMVASPLTHWKPSLRNNIASGSMANVNQGQTRKRDFHFQVTKICQGPKWFFFPSQQSEDQESTSKKSSSDQENERGRSEQSQVSQVPRTITNSESTKRANCFVAEHILRRNSRLRKQQLQQLHNARPVDGDFRGSLTNPRNSESNSEPMTRRIISKPIIQITPSPSIPIKSNSFQEQNYSNSMPSSTFKIISVAKKNMDSDDEEFSFLFWLLHWPINGILNNVVNNVVNNFFNSVINNVLNCIPKGIFVFIPKYIFKNSNSIFDDSIE
ncbi:hypothetical protein FO519_004424 [Halicephalobus sp. NKZ332]|nr:hypothetical protein FO519_004424 [Halicephalobus sp. NKZ332]